MSSNRFPGKVLAPFRGRPLISHVISKVAEALPPAQIVVATSVEASDDPLASYLASQGVNVYRGQLESVFNRFQDCLKSNPCDWFFRISADSPLLDSSLIEMMLPYADSTDVDLVTNVQVRTFPKGHSVEMLNSETFARTDSELLSDEEKEHVTKLFYNHPQRYRIVNIRSGNPELAKESFVVDTLEDLSRLEKLTQTEKGASSEILREKKTVV